MKIVIKPGGYWVFGKPETLFEKELIQDEILSNYAKNIIEGHRQRGFKPMIGREELKELIKEALKHPCPYCGTKMEYVNGPEIVKKNRISADIINPEIKELSVDNLECICTSCNTMKANFNKTEFLQRCELITLTHTYQKEQLSTG